MTRILITSFEPYDRWSENSGWLALVEFTKTMRNAAEITTRRYPVDFAAVREHLARDLSEDYDYALHLGQSPGSGRIHLEAIGLNVGGSSHEPMELHGTLVENGPIAYRSGLPLSLFVRELRRRRIPASVSYHAGTFLCNATLYLTHYLAEQHGLKTQSTFIHLPLETSQAAQESREVSSLPATTAAQALQAMVELLVKQSRPLAPKPA